MNLPSVIIIIMVGIGVILAIRHLASGKGRCGCGHQCGECPSAPQCTEADQKNFEKYRH